MEIEDLFEASDDMKSQISKTIEDLEQKYGVHIKMVNYERSVRYTDEGIFRGNAYIDIFLS